MKVKTILFYLPDGTLNDATEYYIGILEEAFKEKGFKVFEWQVFYSMGGFLSPYPIPERGCAV